MHAHIYNVRADIDNVNVRAIPLRSSLGEMTVDLESSDFEYSDRDRQELLDSPENWSRVRSLPALPGRHIWTMRRESVVGCTLVFLLISLLVSLTQGVALAPGAAAPRPLIYAALALIYTEAAVALLCLLGLLFGNPGEVKRSPQSCFPMPESVADRLSQGESLDGLANVSSDGRTYCAPLQTGRQPGRKDREKRAANEGRGWGCFRLSCHSSSHSKNVAQPVYC